MHSSILSDPSICQTVWTFFGCIPFESDTYMAAYPSINCSSDPEYARLFPFFVLLTIVVCALPLLLFARLYQLNHNGVLWKGETRLVYGIFFEPYKPYVISLPLRSAGLHFWNVQGTILVGVCDAGASTRDRWRCVGQRIGDKTNCSLHLLGMITCSSLFVLG